MDKSGYKVGPSMSMIPYKDIIYLTQVVDGYDLFVNSIIPKSSTRALYAKQVLDRKVNWASYVESKLKGQLQAWKQEGKAHLVGPPCVRQPCRYIPPSSPS